MPSLDGYSLNEKIDLLHDGVQQEIQQLQMDFHNLYNMLNTMKKECKCQDQANVTKSKTQKKDKTA
tara:strand:- start:4139 stop:4336 length:198 start_codon:yes stop_codon:yes gene_type:complete